MQCMNHTSVMLSYIRILDRSWEYRNKLKGTLTLPIHLLTGRQNNNCFFKWSLSLWTCFGAVWKGHD